jgi:DNA-binding CsgD family transcriptional regulator
MRKLQHADAPLACELTPREHQITSLVSAGFSNKEIARWLNLTEATVKTHLHNIYQKARVPNRTALTARFQAIRQANGHAHEFVDAQLGQPGGIAVDAWKAIEASSGPTRRALLRSLQELWIELGNKNKELLQSEQQVLKETQVLYTWHEQFMGV